LKQGFEELITENKLTLTKQSKGGQLLVVLSFTHCPGQCQLHWEFITRKQEHNTN
jgi:cytochrome oxidase Cu insertion factor (SCO1/SenC/PrrC family)